MLQLSLTAFDLETGRRLERRPILKLHDEWGGLVPCRMQLVDGTIVAFAGGTVFRVDLDGRVQWIRRQSYDPEREFQVVARRWQTPPQVVDGSVIVSQPDTNDVDCLDLETGRPRWSTRIRNIDYVARVIGDRVIVRTSEGIVALDRRSGASLWSRREREMCDVFTADAGGNLVYARCDRLNLGFSPPEFVRVDLQDGTELGVHPIAAFEPKERQRPVFMFGPLVTDGERWFVFYNRQERKPDRRFVVELLPKR